MRCGIALGSNLGERLGYLRQARQALEALHTGAAVPLVSPVYETEPVDCAPGTAAYFNAVMEIETDESPIRLLGALQQIEATLGRPAASERPRNAPRTVDLDLLYVGETRLEGERLTLPHPRLDSRRFVLQPLADIRPDLLLPGQPKPVAALLAQLPPEPGVTLVTRHWPVAATFQNPNSTHHE